MTEYNDNFPWDDNDGYLMAGCLQVVGVVGTTIVAMLLCLLMGSCTTTKYVPMPEYHNDTVRVTQYQRDSIYMHDSILVRQHGDTVTIDRWSYALPRPLAHRHHLQEPRRQCAI